MSKFTELRKKVLWYQNIKFGIVKERLNAENWQDFEARPFRQYRHMIDHWLNTGQIFFLTGNDN